MFKKITNYLFPEVVEKVEKHNSQQKAKEKEEVDSILTPIKQLGRIVGLSAEHLRFDPTRKYHSEEDKSKVRFFVEREDAEKILDTCPIPSMQLIGPYYGGYGSGYGGGRYVVECDYKEYAMLYRNPYYNYIEEEVKPVLERVVQKKEDQMIRYMLISYEITFTNIANTIKDCHEINGHMTKEVADRIKVLMDKFIADVVKHEEELKQIALEQKKRLNKSLIERLDEEIEVMNRTKIGIEELKNA